MIRRILDAKYEKDDLNKFMDKKRKHFNAKERYIILALLWKFEDLFDGTLGMWNIITVNLELEDNTKPVCSRLYPVLRVHKAIFKN